MHRLPRKLKKELKKKYKQRYGIEWLSCTDLLSMFIWIYKNPLKWKINETCINPYVNRTFNKAKTGHYKA